VSRRRPSEWLWDGYVPPPRPSVIVELAPDEEARFDFSGVPEFETRFRFGFRGTMDQDAAGPN
jgi:hypothetical protein